MDGIRVSKIWEIGPGLFRTTPYNIIYHPATGLCIRRNTLKLGPCRVPAAWIYTPQNTLTLKGPSNSCLQAVGLGKSPVIGNACSNPSSVWKAASDSKLHLSSKYVNTMVCLDIDAKGFVITNQCKCLYGDFNCDPTSQWFKIITSSRDVAY